MSIVRASWGIGSKVLTDMLIPEASTEEQEEMARGMRESASPEVAALTFEMLYGFDVREDLGASPLLPSSSIVGRTGRFHHDTGGTWPPGFPTQEP